MTSTLLLSGRVFFLVESAERVRAELAGQDFTLETAGELARDVSTDEMAPAWASYYFDERLAEHCLTGFRGGSIGLGAVRAGGFEVLVGGENFGCGSSRETAPYAQLLAGVRLVVAPSFGRIYRQNAQNIGLFTTTDLGVLARLARGETLDPDALSGDADAVTREIARHGGLLAYAKARARGAVTLPVPAVLARPQTLAEKLIAAHTVRDATGGAVGVPSVAPGDSLFVRADLRFSHEYVTPMADALLRRAFGEDARVREPEGVLLFRDHLTFAADVLGGDPRKLPLLEQAALLPDVQARFAERHGLRLLGEIAEPGRRGSVAICHEAVLESFAEPGAVVVGTDSHTSTAGAVGCVAFGVGSTDMAAAWVTGDVRLRVPPTVRVELVGRLAPNVTAKDAMLALFATPLVRSGKVTGAVLEFGGPGLATLPLDERATLTNMAVEAGALTGICEVDAVTLRELAELRGDRNPLAARAARPDPEALYAGSATLDLAAIEPMLALPGDPKRVAPLAEVVGRGAPRVDIAYAGSCTGGKRRDMDLYAAVLGPAVARGERVASGVRLFVQMGSERVRRYAEERGYLAIFERAGATILGSACGACIAAGPGTSRAAEEVTISAGSRNFPGRSGPGQVLLASPLVVAASALAGVVAPPPSYVTAQA
ncbi:MAG TPA: aconitase family protein [Polyangiaceae bacterium]|nr:aconitase family protein [Polyangiaceae bacterium]